MPERLRDARRRSRVRVTSPLTAASSRLAVRGKRTVCERLRQDPRDAGDRERDRVDADVCGRWRSRRGSGRRSGSSAAAAGSRPSSAGRSEARAPASRRCRSRRRGAPRRQAAWPPKTAPTSAEARNPDRQRRSGRTGCARPAPIDEQRRRVRRSAVTRTPRSARGRAGSPRAILVGDHRAAGWPARSAATAGCDAVEHRVAQQEEDAEAAEDAEQPEHESHARSSSGRRAQPTSADG